MPRQQPSRHVAVTASGRQQGKTTALLDVAIANARRGVHVEFWSPTARASHEAFRMAVDLLRQSPAGDSVVVASNGNDHVRFVSGGRVSFVDVQRNRWCGRGHGRAELEIVDEDGNRGAIHWPGDRDRQPRVWQ